MGQHGTLAAWLKQYRVAAGLTQERLAERANLSVRSLSNLERGLNRAPRPETLDRLMDVFELSWDERALLRVAALPADAATLAVTDIAPVDDAVVDLPDLDASSADVRHICDCGTHQEIPASRTGTTAVTEVFPRTAGSLWEHVVALPMKPTPGREPPAASRGVALLRQGQAGDGAVEIERACRRALVAGQLSPLTELLATAASACLVTAEWELALAYVERGQQVAERGGDTARVVFLHFLRGCVLFHKGEWGNAQAILEQGADLANSPSAWPTAHCPWLGLGVLALARGDLSGAARFLERSTRRAVDHGDARALPYLQATLAELDLLAARPRAAQTRLGALLNLREQQGLTGFVQIRLAWAQLELGRPATAARTAASAVGRARAEHAPVRVVDGLWVQARALLGCDCRLEAAAVLDEALALARRLPYALGVERALESAADLQAGLGYPILAQTYLDEALGWCDRLGAAQRRARLAERLTAFSQNRSDPSQYSVLPSQNPLLASQNPANPSQNPPVSSQNGPVPPIPAQITEAQWARIAALLPPSAPTGRPRADDRRTLEAILHARRTGCPWSAMPPALGNGKTAHHRLREWQDNGLWERIAGILSGDEAGS